MNMVIRQQYALKMLELLRERKRIINIDESWLNETILFVKLGAKDTDKEMQD